MYVLHVHGFPPFPESARFLVSRLLASLGREINIATRQSAGLWPPLRQQVSGKCDWKHLDPAAPAACVSVCLSVLSYFILSVSAIWPHRSRVRRTELGLPLRSADKLRVGPTATPPPAPSHFAAKQPTIAQTTRGQQRLRDSQRACICVAVRSALWPDD